MILFFNNSPGAQTSDSVETGIQRIVATVLEALKSQRIPDKQWDGDYIQVEKQFPVWIQKLYKNNNTEVPVIDFFKAYYRWLYNIDGYGMGFYIESIRDVSYVPDVFLQAYADIVFYEELDFSEYPELTNNFRNFYLNYHKYYVQNRGTPDGMCYILKSLFGASYANVTTTSPTTIRVISDIKDEYKNLFVKLACPYSFNVKFATL